jgi:Asp-tRNA(Asn)/Glu-tRNA(Gln) amidotransferase B subunit
VQQVVSAQPDAVAQYRAGKKATFGFLVGEAMRASGGKADPKRLSQLLRATLDA